MHQRKIYLKGHNKVKDNIWKGLDITLSFVGSVDNKRFGIERSKLTMDQALKMNKMKSFTRFHNLKLKNLSYKNAPRGSFEEINITNSNNINSFFKAPKVLKYKSLYENDIIYKLSEVYLQKIRNRKKYFNSYSDNPSKRCTLKKSVCVQTDNSSLETQIENDNYIKKIIEEYNSKREKLPLLKESRAFISTERSRNIKMSNITDKIINCKSMANVNRKLYMNSELTLFLNNKY